MKNNQNKNNIVISTAKITKSFKDIVAVNDVDLNIIRGEYVALLGPNGAGKTTLIEMIEGIQKPDKGTIVILGETWKSKEHNLRNLMGISLQETRFFDKITVLETMSLFASFYKQKKSRINDLLEVTGLNEKIKSYVMNLSGGQKQKLALAVALINSPDILLLDEPTTGLDPSARRDIWNILINLKSSKTTMILTTHYMDEAEYLCDRILIMDKGKFIAEGTLDELLSVHGASEIIEFSSSDFIDTNILSHLNDVININYDNQAGKGRILVKSIVNTLPNFLEIVKNNNLTLLNLECRRMTLDDLFISLTGRHLAED